MITISKKVEYSVVFMSYLAKDSQKIISLTEAAKKLNLPYRFLGQLAMQLKQSGLVMSKEGKTGGYSLAADWEDRTLYDLIEALGENKHMVKCLGSVCNREKECAMRGVWGKLETSFRNELKTIKLKEL
jgi:Rrf2 family protein